VLVNTGDSISGLASLVSSGSRVNAYKAIASPVLSSLSPISAAAGIDPFALTVSGFNFENGAVVYWNGTARPTTFVSNKQLTATIAASDVSSVGTATVTVNNPAVGLASGGTPFSVYAVPPGAPTIGTAAAGNGQATVTFTAPDNDGGSAITGYTVTSSPGNISAAGAASPITVTGLTNGTAYTFTVTATNEVGTGAASAASNSVTPATTVPGAPTIGTAAAGNGQATVTFTAPDNDGGSAITGYAVTSSPGNISAAGAASPITVTGLTNGTAYTFTVKATNAMGTGAASASSNSVTPGTSVPGGDINGDGEVSATDALKALRFAAGLDTASATDLDNGDVAPLVGGVSQPDGMIDIGDVVVILRKAVELI
jgi:hypothetical protein